MSAQAAARDAWEREGSAGRYDMKLAPVGGKLPTDGRDRVVFCFSYGEKFSGDNHEEALNYAAFCVYYLKGMRLPPYDGEGES